MKVVVTGANGTVGRALCMTLGFHGHEVIGWDRTQVPVNDYAAIENFLRKSGAEAVFHLAVASQPTGMQHEGAVVNYHWPSEVAWAARQLGIKFVFTSTAMVFTNDAKGPFTRDSPADATQGYGGEELRAEQRVRDQCPEARVVRLGWQIGTAPGGNNMLSYLQEHMDDRGRVSASTRWLPACSFLDDTAEALVQVLDLPPGLYHADSNRGWNFFEIAQALSALHGGVWKIEPTEDFVYDQRLLDDRLVLPSLATRLDLALLR